MQVLSLILNNNYDLNFNLGKEIGYGADGQIFLLEDFPNRVIKLCVLYDWNENDIEASYSNVIKTLSFIKEERPNICARVYEYGFLFKGTRYTYASDADYITYYYIMEKLYKTNEDERKVFHSLLSHEDRGAKKEYTFAEALNMLIGMHRGLDFNLEKVYSFYKEVKGFKLNHNDLHVRNIMKDLKGNFRLVDFDRAQLGE